MIQQFRSLVIFDKDGPKGFLPYLNVAMVEVAYRTRRRNCRVRELPELEDQYDLIQRASLQQGADCAG